MQAIALDALRYAIDTVCQNTVTVDQDQLGTFWYRASMHDVLLAAWLSAAAAIINAPGHTAQYLKPSSSAGYKRVHSYWNRDVFRLFERKLREVPRVGTSSWRKNNRVGVADALDVLDASGLPDLSVVYADPPYTKDQYSRYYHVYETLYAYDFPDSRGAGRVRSDRFLSDFCYATRVCDALTRLIASAMTRRVPLVLSYPSAGLFDQSGDSLETHLHALSADIRVITLPIIHSTFGASTGRASKPAEERLYVIRPA